MLGSLLGRLYRVAVGRLSGRPVRDPHVERDANLLAAATSAEYVSRHMTGARNLVHREALLRYALEHCSIEGLTLEFGVYRGASLCAIADLTPDTVHGFDSFEGLPEDWTDTQKKGRFSLAGEVPRLNRPNIELVKGWFQDTLPPFLSEHDGPARFVHLDCDLYSSAVTVLQQLRPRIVAGTVILFDEYLNYPGWEQHEYKAFQEFIAATGLVYEYLGYASTHYSVAVKIGERQDRPVDSRAREQNALGLEHLSGNRPAEAARAFARAIELQHDFAEAHLNLGKAYERQQQAEDAADCYRLAVHFDPRLPEAHLKLGQLALISGAREEALEHFDRAAQARPDLVEAQVNAALVLYQLGRYEEARARSEAALRVQPGLPEASHNLGLALLALGQPAAALESLQRALSARPRFPECLAAIGHALRDLGRIDEAIARYDAALALAPELGDAYINRCYARLLAGDFARGWQEYERRFAATDTAERGFPYPEWDGEALAGRTLLVYAEQGLGDEIMFASCLPEVIAVASGCVIECHTRLAPLYRRSFPQAHVHGAQKQQDKTWLAGAPRIDVQIAIGSLPLHLRRTRDAFPSHAGYLHADPDRVAYWRSRLARGGTGLRVGLSWRGGTVHTRQRLRSLPIEDLLGAFAGAGMRLISLQYGDCEAEVAGASKKLGVPVEHWPEALRDLDETAALISALDWVVTIDNTIAHLAGALGRPGLVLLSSSPEWRYLAQGEDALWYPSLRLVRQPAPGDWRTVLHGLAARAGELTQGDGTADRYRSALTLLKSGDTGRAEAELLAVIEARHDHAGAHYALGSLYEKLARKEDAADSYHLAVCFQPDLAAAHYRLGVLAAESGQRDEALEHFGRAVASRPDHAEAYNYMGKIYLETHRPEQSQAHFRKATAANPAYARAWSNLAYVVHEQRSDFGEALACADRAIALDPGLLEAHCNRAMVLQSLGRSEEALRACEDALKFDPGHAESRVNRALALLMLGDFERGWAEYETRLQTYECFRYRSFPYARWGGESLRGRTVLVYAEQGLGDEIMFASCLPQVLEQAGRCVIDCSPKLEKLFRRSFEGATIHGGHQTDRDLSWLKAVEPVDCQVASGTLPLYLRRRAEDFPRHGGYLRADAGRVAHWRERLSGLGPGLKVGLSWRGGSKYTHRGIRSLELAQLAPLLRVPGVQFVSLQYTDCRQELEALRESQGLQVHHWQEAIDDYDETAALVSALDLVVSVQTALVHLAGALGKEVWVMVSAAPEWRYQRHGESMPWYPSVRVLRQGELRQWQPLIERVARELAQRAAPAQPLTAEECQDAGLRSLKAGALAEAERLLARAIELDPARADAHFALAGMMRKRGEHDAARRHLEQAVAADSGHAGAHSNLAHLLFARYDEVERALEHAHRARDLAPGLIDAHLNCGMIEQFLGRCEPALAAADAVLERDPGNPRARVGRGLALLTMGDFERGWPEFEARQEVNDRDLRLRSFPYARWAGEPLRGRTVLVYAEQGLGDEIMFASCLPQVLEQAGRCVIDCSPKLEKLFRRSFEGATIHGGHQTDRDLSWLKAVEPVDCQVASGTLPLYLRRRAEDFPRHGGYLRADAGRVAHWRERLSGLGPGLKVGLSWRGGSKYTHRGIRSLELAQLAPLLRVPGVQFVSLQYTDCRQELEALRESQGLQVHHWQEAIDDYDETAALVSALDLVVSVQTALVHLAGALGKEVWVMVSAAPEWRYQRHGESMPWYPSVRVLRQGELRQWQPLIERVARELAQRAGPAALLEHGIALARARDYGRARTALDQLTAQYPEFLDGLNARANLERLQGNWDAAESWYRRALAVEPRSAAVLANLGGCLKDAGRLDAASRVLEQAAELAPDDMDVRLNLAAAQVDCGRWSEAAAELRRILERQPDMAEAHTSLGHILLARGEFAAGWEEYEWRYQSQDAKRQVPYPYPVWNGEPLGSRTLLVRAEQGLGDQIMFASCVPDLRTRAPHCMLECDPRLVALFARAFPEVSVHRKRADNPELWRDAGHAPAAQLFLSSLPRFFRGRAGDFPAHRGYLRADPEKVRAWLARLEGTGPGLKVGFSWRGGAPQTRQSLRSIPLPECLPILRTPGVRFISLQYGNCAEEIGALREATGLELHHWPEAIADYDQTAALVHALDLVISVQTSVVHLAGALGKEAWVLVPAVPEWRYMAGGNTMPWYPSVRLYRQERLLDWGPLAAAIAELLAERASSVAKRS